VDRLATNLVGRQIFPQFFELLFSAGQAVEHKGSREWDRVCKDGGSFFMIHDHEMGTVGILEARSIKALLPSRCDAHPSSCADSLTGAIDLVETA